MPNKNEQKSLSEVFRELELNRNKQVEIYKAQKKAKEQDSFLFHVKNRTKHDNIKLTIIVLVVFLVFSLFSSNYIFATDLDFDKTEVKTAIGKFEKNNNPVDIYKIMSENMSTKHQKEVVEQDEQIEYEIQYIPNKDMPEDETKLIQEGTHGRKLVTYVREYENGVITEENIIGQVVLVEPLTAVVEIGTSRILKTYNIHIGDNLYTSQNVGLKKNCSENAEDWLIIPAYYDVKTIEVIDDSWLKVSYNGTNTGYISCEYLTSETLTPGIVELSRRAKVLNKVNINMALNEPSGLTLDDYAKIISTQNKDTNGVFKNNYKAFYDAENKYGINGIFLMSIGIHESGWGKSAIAINKYNLFGFGAYDASPYDSAVTFSSYAEGIDTVAAWLASNYLNPQGTKLKDGTIATGRYYNGPTVTGVNIKYATDPEWGTKVFSVMQSLYAEF